MDDDPTITVYADASFDVYSDSKSHSGITVFISGAGASVYCTSNKQHCLARSSCDSEIITLETSTFIGSYFRDVLKELRLKVKVVYMEDNQSCIKLVESGTQAYDRKERHVVRRINYMHELFSDPENQSTLVFCGTLDMIADILTKPLGQDLFIIFKRYLMGINPHLLPKDEV
jgi:hypothetical protein